MRNGWYNTTIGDLGRIVTGKTPPTVRPELFGEEYPFITPTDIYGLCHTVSTARFLSEEGRQFQETLLLPTGTVCFVCIGATIGKLCVTGQSSFTNQQINSVIVNENQHDSRFVYYLLRHETDRIKAVAGGAATPIVNKTSFSSMPVDLPSLEVERKIAGVLSAYDDLIENNTRRIKLLERMQSPPPKRRRKISFHTWWIYLDKPMKNHTLMQTIARANRVFGDKNNGLIVDYVGVFRDLQKALAVYGTESEGGIGPGGSPVQDKSKLVKELTEAVGEMEVFCSGLEIDLTKLLASKGYAFISLRDGAIDAILVNEESKRKYMSLSATVDRLYKSVLPDPSANEFGPRVLVFNNTADRIRSLSPPIDITQVMQAVEILLDESIATEGYVIRETKDVLVDLSRIDFEALRKQFERSHKRLEAERLKGAIQRKLRQLVRLNKSRMDYLEKFQQMLDEYNAGASNVAEFFAKLIEFAKELTVEERRALAEQLTEEELAIFDMLTKPEMKLTSKEEIEVKRVARELLETLKREKLVLDWRKRQQSRASVRLCIEEILDRLPPCYAPQIFQQKCEAIYQHVYESYYDHRRSVYIASI